MGDHRGEALDRHQQVRRLLLLLLFGRPETVNTNTLAISNMLPRSSILRHRPFPPKAAIYFYFVPPEKQSPHSNLSPEWCSFTEANTISPTGNPQDDIGWLTDRALLPLLPLFLPPFVLLLPRRRRRHCPKCPKAMRCEEWVMPPPQHPSSARCGLSASTAST